MTENKRKKNSRQRGSWTHGWGAKKKHRGAGHRGGRGNAGSGKKGDAKKTKFWEDVNYFGKRGFTSQNQKTTKIKTINLAHLEAMLDSLVAQGKATKQKDMIKINLSELKYNKLLGAGKVNSKFELTVDCASESAVNKVTQAGGKVTVLPKKEKEKASNEA